MKKIRVAVLFGGKSAEHEVSLQSAKNVIEAMDKEKYEVVLIGIDKTGKWQLYDRGAYLLNEQNPKLIALNTSHSDVSITPGKSMKLTASNSRKGVGSIAVVFPVLHGTYGEDGTMQGLLKLLDVPFVGAGVLGSAVGMDKDVMKRLLRDAGLPTAKFEVYTTRSLPDFPEVKKEFGLPFFVKPANAGSSVGVHKVHAENEYKSAVANAFLYDTKILIEETVPGREIECSVLGNEDPIASVPGEIIPHHEFYSYEAKYIDENGAGLAIPAPLPAEITKKVQNIALAAYQILCCEGMARVDMFLTKENNIIFNEINTIPGFTKISMYPKLWEASGMPYTKLIDMLIALAIARHKREKKLKTTW